MARPPDTTHPRFANDVIVVQDSFSHPELNEIQYKLRLVPFLSRSLGMCGCGIQFSHAPFDPSGAASWEWVIVMMKMIITRTEVLFTRLH